MKSLVAVHSAGIVHCDIRKSNILRFGDDVKSKKYQLIDFDHAVDVNDEVTFREGEQFDSRGWRFRRSDIGDKVSWGIADDYQMLLGMLMKYSDENIEW